jgi:antitoxin (DNA-binding transcriptional repressor) of toxin-antitoxin stability system
MIQVNIHQAKTHLSRLARRIRAGEVVTLCDRNRPFAEIRPLPGGRTVPARGRPLGLYAGQVSIKPDFDSPETNQHLAMLFSGSAGRG